MHALWLQIPDLRVSLHNLLYLFLAQSVIDYLYLSFDVLEALFLNLVLAPINVDGVKRVGGCGLPTGGYLRDLEPLAASRAQLCFIMNHYTAELQVDLLPAQTLLLAEIAKEIVGVYRCRQCIGHFETMCIAYASKHRYIAALFRESLSRVDA